MLDRGVQLVSLHHKCCLFGSHSQVLIFGLMLVFHTALSHIQASGVKCKSKNISVEFQHCRMHQDGVRDLDCFSKPEQVTKNCTWKPGKHTSNNTYTLILQQRRRSCYIFYNITKFYEMINKVFTGYDMKVEVFENADTSKCTKAAFSGSPNHMIRCDPPSSVNFSRHSGKLNMSVSWNKVEEKFIKYFSVRFKEVGDSSWNKSSVQSKDRNNLSMENLRPSVKYVAQIQCVPNDKCSQCPWSEDHIVQSELKTQPVIIGFEETADKPGRRWISVTWKFPAEENRNGYKVTIWKTSGEAPQDKKKTFKPEIRLLLSYSAYQLKISAFNKASDSPSVSLMIPQQENMTNVGDRRLNVTIYNSTSLTLSWKHDLIKEFVCYSVEWGKKGHSALYKSFYENTNNYRNLSHLPEPLEPYKRYSMTLHTRPYKDTCNIKRINDSESTYGTTLFYFRQGSPVSAPTNISFSNETLDSVVMQWSCVPEEDLRGFLLGYIIHYIEYHNLGTESNITLEQESNSYELKNLKSGTAYQVQISAFTSAGRGVQSAQSFFKTQQNGNIKLTGLIAVFVVVATLLMFGSPVIKRVKAIMWPSIPNPGDSNAVQKIDGPGQLELLEAIATLKVEEWDTKSLQILERKDVITAGMLQLMLPLLRTSEDQDNSPEMTCNWIQTDRDSPAEDNPPDTLDTQQMDLQSSPLPFTGDYTTMEMFKQLIPQDVEKDTRVTAVIKNDPDNMMVKALRIDYVRQFSTSPPSDSEDMSTIF
ncbi:interleukin-31 receptor subunit alpha [Kryptolebias marmoratus]|uniref:interleukin-31 receptor subunit alpha n=1 Tax=Kryptolebias marmoratus TaxID=37003 RepID=UPI0007F91EF0|nr:interleukin-31 receptor subunit alpha [Kryptolebias marmoratus]